MNKLKTFLKPYFKDSSKILFHIGKYNLKNLVINCTLFTIMFLIGLPFINNPTYLINSMTYLLIFYFLLIIFSIYVNKYKSNSIYYYLMINFAFILSTIIWYSFVALTLKESYEFLYYYLSITLLYSLLLLSLPIIHFILVTYINLIGFYYMISLNHHIFFSLIITYIYLFTIAINIYKYNSAIKFYKSNERLQKDRELLDNLANKDHLTNLYNNNYVFEQLKYEIERTKRYQFPLSIMLINIDDLKNINRRYTQIAGDDVVKTIANILVSSCRATDVIGRYAGEEFLVVLANTNHSDAIIFAERIRLLINNHTFTYGKVSVSIGIKKYEHDSLDHMIKGVQIMLDDAKSNGKNNIVY